MKDVCDKCNNGRLDSLDAYGKEIYDWYFSSIVYEQETIDISFDADKLLRWLLKPSFNSRRAHMPRSRCYGNSGKRISSDYDR